MISALLFLAACAPSIEVEGRGLLVDPKSADADGDGYADDVDCDDADIAVNPGASEACNAADDDCDADVDEGACGCTWATDGRHTFQLCTTSSTWAAAEATCAGWGYHLADVDDAAEDAWLWSEVGSVAAANWWFGFNDRGAEGTFSWDGGSDSPYTNWRAGEPNDFGGSEDCTWYATTGGGQWNDKDCAATAYFACEAGCATSTRYVDADGDGYGDPALSERACTDEPGLVDDATDCDDADPALHPGAGETCDAVGVDEDCDGLVDDADPDVDPAGFGTFYADGDGDGHAGTTAAVRACAAPAGYASSADDCDDGDAASYPGAAETPADGVDQDCDGADTCTWYADADGDGWGDASAPIEDCAGVPPGFVAFSGDCDDTAATTFPGAPDVPYDGVDADCAGDNDDDADHDGVEASAAGGGDCDDGDAGVFPGANEICDGVDEDCDGELDGGAADCPVAAQSYDGHSYLFQTSRLSWADAQAACAAYGYHLADVHDAAEEAWIWGVAEPLDSAAHWWHGFNDEAAEGTFAWDGGSTSTFTDWRAGEPNDYAGNEDCGAFADDGGGAWNDRDCAQTAPYVCEAGCELLSLFADADGDGFGDPASPGASCTIDVGFVVDGTDCDDSDPRTNPGAAEVCDDDGRDEDCDGKVDDLDPSLDPTSRGTFYGDKDHDGHGVPDDTWLGCHPPEGFAVVADDCDDDDPMIHPGTPDPDDGVDEDCDGAAESYDSDRDGVPDTTERPLGLDPDDSDSDADGRPDGVELGDPAAPTDTDGDGTLDALDEDDDGDTLPTADELGDPAAPNDTDGDGTIDALDLDSDADGTPDAVEAGRDSDHDGVPNAREADDDGDGRLSAAEDATNPDADGDQVPNSLDADSDGDGCPDVAESDDAWLDAADASACPVDSGTPAPDPGRRDDASEGCGCATGASGPGGTAIAALAGLAFLTRRRGARAEAAAALHPMRSRRPPGPLDP